MTNHSKRDSKCQYHQLITIEYTVAKNSHPDLHTTCRHNILTVNLPLFPYLSQKPNNLSKILYVYTISMRQSTHYNNI